MIYSYGGFEAALIASGETRNARKDIPFALFVAIGATTLLYIAVQYLVIHTIPNAGRSAAPVVDSARGFLPYWAVRIVAAGTLISAYGYLSANVLHTPRVFCHGRARRFPGFLRQHPSPFSNPACLDHDFCRAAFDIFHRRRFSLERAALQRRPPFRLRLGRRRFAGAA